MELAIDIKKQDREALRWILDFDYRKQAYIEAVAQFNTLGATAYNGMPHGSGVGNPTQQKAVTLTELERQKNWIMTVEAMERTLSEKRRAFLEFRRRAEGLDGKQERPGRPAWSGYVQVRYGEWHERRYGVAVVPGRKTMDNWINEMIDVTVRIAIRKGCL